MSLVPLLSAYNGLFASTHRACCIDLLLFRPSADTPRVIAYLPHGQSVVTNEIR